jgi:hypothetical protein
MGDAVLPAAAEWYREVANALSAPQAAATTEKPTPVPTWSQWGGVAICLSIGDNGRHDLSLCRTKHPDIVPDQTGCPRGDRNHKYTTLPLPGLP